MIETCEANLPSYQIAMRVGDVRMLKIRLSDGTSKAFPYTRLKAMNWKQESLTLTFPDCQVKIFGTELDKLCREIAAYKVVAINEPANPTENCSVRKVELTPTGKV